MVERLTGSQEVRGFESLRLHRESPGHSRKSVWLIGVGADGNVAKNVATHSGDRSSQRRAAGSARRGCRLEGRRDARSRLPSPTAAPGVGLARKSTKESDWHDVPLLDSVMEAFERQLARRRGELARGLGRTSTSRGRPRGDQADPTGLAERSACRSHGPSSVTLQDLRHYVRDDQFRRRCAKIPDHYEDLLGNSEVTPRLHYDGQGWNQGTIRPVAQDGHPHGDDYRG